MDVARSHVAELCPLPNCEAGAQAPMAQPWLNHDGPVLCAVVEVFPEKGWLVHKDLSEDDPTSELHWWGVDVWVSGCCSLLGAGMWATGCCSF